jgi:hypothetical protein
MRYPTSSTTTTTGTTTTAQSTTGAIGAALRGRAVLLAAALAAVLGVGALGAGPLGVGPAAADAATLHVTSSNWAGYAARRTGVAFHRVSGSWTVPTVDCASGGSAYSANWVGLGGYATTSKALEQLGTESDCSASGKASYSAWFEIVPAAATTAHVTIRPGDAITASATVTGHRVTLTIANTTRGTKVTKSVIVSTVDTSSAEWIVEAPSLCTGSADASCRQTALANVGTTGFTAARATTSSDHVGTVLDSAWNAIALTLSPAAHRGPGFLPGRFAGTPPTAGTTAIPGALTAVGDAFTVAVTSS